MKTIRMTVLGAAAAAVLSITLPSLPALAGDSVNLSFDVGNVRMGYTDGYWDNNHSWHRWSNAREHHAYRDSYHDRYVAGRHTRYPNHGWRDSDGDGVPDNRDSHPNNPNRD